MIKILINGINGNMGTEVANLIKSNPNMHLLCGLDKHVSHKLSYPIFDNINDILEKPNVIIDFSSPDATLSILPFALKYKIPIVIATTGFNEMQQKQIEETSLQIPIFQCSNMSYQITLMSKIVAQISKQLQNSEIEIVETHHNRKKDAPSGTALLLADSINKANNSKYYYEFNRHKKNEKRNLNEIGFSSIRGGNVVGEHQVLFFNDYETLEIKHTSYSRTIFAEGSLKAAEFILNKQNGLFTMSNL